VYRCTFLGPRWKGRACNQRLTTSKPSGRSCGEPSGRWTHIGSGPRVPGPIRGLALLQATRPAGRS